MVVMDVFFRKRRPHHTLGMASNLPGITLIEILISVTILSLLILAGVYFVMPTMQRARDGERKADLKKIAAALEQYRDDHGGYPQQLGSGSLVSGCGPGTPLEPYMKDVPCDPRGGPYIYNPAVEGNATRPGETVYRRYRLLARLEYTSDPLIEEICPAPDPDAPDHCGGVYQETVGGSNVSIDANNLYNYGVASGMKVDQAP